MNRDALLAKKLVRLAEVSKFIGTPEVLDGGDSSRIISYRFSDSSVGRDYHTIASTAWRLGNFLKNNVFLWGHESGQPPIGKVLNLRTENGILRGDVQYADEETYPFANTIFQLVKGGYLNATSTSWIPLDWKVSRDKARPGGVDFTSVELLEISQVPVPALPSALVEARATGINTRPLYDWAEQILDLKRDVGITRVDLEKMRLDSKMPKTITTKSTEERKLSAAAKTERFNGAAAGFENFGQFLQSVARAGSDAPQFDSRLVRAPTGASEVDPTGGGFLIPMEFYPDMIGSIYEDAVLAGLVTKLKSAKPYETRIPGIDETSRQDGSRWGGSSAFWSAEAVTQSPSLPKFKNIVFAPNKLIAFFVASEELISDAPLLEFNAKRAFQSELGFKIDAAIFSGTGAGQPLGIMNSPALIAVAKETGQAAATITSKNVDDMWSRLPAPCRKRAVWVVCEDADLQLSKMKLEVGTGGSASENQSYIAPGAAGNETALLKGRPVVVVEQASPLGTPGDIVLADLSQYALLDSAMRTDISLHVNFLQFQGNFRFTLRIDGKGLWGSPITPFNGGQTRSPFVALAAR